MNKQKKVIILWHNGGRLCNQLWLHISVSAYCIEKNYIFENYSLFEYSEYFNFKNKNKFINFFYFRPYIVLKSYLKINSVISLKVFNKLFRLYYKIYIKIKTVLNRGSIIKIVNDNELIYLPPTINIKKNKIEYFDSNDKKNLYLSGWLFRNPVGIAKHREKILENIRPEKKYIDQAKNFITPIRKKYKHVIGVHIRQGDYLKIGSFKEFSFQEKEIKKLLISFIDEFNLELNDTCFVVCSDGKIKKEVFEELNIEVSNNFYIVDLLILSLTDKIIGSNSTFGTFASYYGNIPFIVIDRNGIDWKNYKDKKIFFEDKKCTMTHY